MVLASELTGRLIIVTSFPETVFNRFKSAFEAKNPGLKVHVRSKKTSAAISFVQEAKVEPVDLLWLSAPDAFEVLKKSGHLAQAFEVPVEKFRGLEVTRSMIQRVTTGVSQCRVTGSCGTEPIWTDMGAGATGVGRSSQS